MAATRLRIVDAELAHVYRLAANMRQADVETARMLGRDPKLALRISYKSSPFYRRAALAGDDVLAMWGLGGDVLSEIGFPWLVTSKTAPARRLELLKAGRLELGEMSTRKRLLIDYAPPDDPGVARFLRFFGFAHVGEGPQIVGSGPPWQRYELRRPGRA